MSEIEPIINLKIKQMKLVPALASMLAYTQAVKTQFIGGLIDDIGDTFNAAVDVLSGNDAFTWSCQNTNIDKAGRLTADRDGDDCNRYSEQPHWCDGNGAWDDADFRAMEMCCVCGGGRR